VDVVIGLGSGEDVGVDRARVPREIVQQAQNLVSARPWISPGRRFDYHRVRAVGGPSHGAWLMVTRTSDAPGPLCLYETNEAFMERLAGGASARLPSSTSS
jgi:hypothetical protein